MDNCRLLFGNGLDLRLDRNEYLSFVRISFGMLLSLSFYFSVLALYKRPVYLYSIIDVINEIQIRYFPIVVC